MMQKKRFWAWLLCVAMLISLVNGLSLPAAAAAPTVRVEPVITYATDAGAFVKNLKFSQQKAWNLTITADAEKGGNTFAVVLRYDLFNANYNSNGSIGGINQGTYTNLKPGTDNPNYYRYQTTAATAGQSVTLLNKDLHNFNSGNTGYQVGESSNTYHMRYAVIIFDGGTTTENLSDYTIAEFYINSQGWLQTESYMLRYMSNNKSVGTSEGVSGVPAYQIEGWKTDAEVNTTATPSRKGYSFLGWDANKDLMSTDPNTAAGQTVSPQYPHKAGEKNLPWSTVSAAFGTEAFSKTSDKFYNLYAIWRPQKVTFDTQGAAGTAGSTGTNTGTRKVVLSGGADLGEVAVITMDAPQVGVDYTGQKISLVAPSNTSTEKKYEIITGATISWTEENREDGTQVPKQTKSINTLTEYGLGYGTNAAYCGIGSAKGGPTNFSDDEVLMLLKATDNTNKTTDYIIVRFAQILKGNQVKPSIDTNTGLQTRIEPRTVTETVPDPDGEEGATKEVSTTVQDGQIYGFYSLGTEAADGAEKGYTADKNGKGTMTDYYLNNFMVFEYRPVSITTFNEAGEANPDKLVLVDTEKGIDAYKDADSEYSKLPNGGWREMPFPKDWYNADNAKLTDLEPTMGKNAKTLAKSAWNEGKELTVETPEGFAGWLDSYGSIEFDEASGLPIIHGLHDGDKYEVRFRANKTHEASKESQILTIGGAVGSGNSGPTEADPSSCAAIVFYDWDETTVLGTLVVVKGQDATKLVEDFAKNLQAPTSRDITKNENDKFFVDDANYPLTYKKGYSFEGCWLPFESETPTVYGYRVSALNANQSTTPERPTSEEANFSNVTQDMVVKAAYNQNAELAVSNATNRRYTTTAVSYTRFGTTLNYGITVEVRRENSSSAGVPRIISPALKVTLTTSAGDILMQIPLDSTDVTTAQIVANSAVKKVTWTVVETYNNNNWVGAAVRASNGTSNAGTMNVQNSGFLYSCTLGGINDMLEEYTTMAEKSTTVYNYINNNSLTGIGLTIPAGLSATDAKNKLLAAWEDKNCVRNEDGTPKVDEEGKKVIKSKSERQGLTFDEMQAALAS